MKFITREELNKELEKKGYAEVLGYYYYDVCNYKYEQNIKSKSTDIYDVLSFDQDGNNIYGFNIYEDDPYNQYEKRTVPSKNLVEDYKMALIQKAYDLKNNELNIVEYIKTTKLPLQALIMFIKNNKVPFNSFQSLYNKKGFYETLSKPFILEEYLESTKFKDEETGKLYKPTVEIVEKAVINAQHNDILMNYVNIKSIIVRMIRGELDENEKFSYDHFEHETKLHRINRECKKVELYDEKSYHKINSGIFFHKNHRR